MNTTTNKLNEKSADSSTEFLEENYHVTHGDYDPDFAINFPFGNPVSDYEYSKIMFKTYPEMLDSPEGYKPYSLFTSKETIRDRYKLSFKSELPTLPDFRVMTDHRLWPAFTIELRDCSKECSFDKLSDHTRHLEEFYLEISFKKELNNPFSIDTCGYMINNIVPVSDTDTSFITFSDLKFIQNTTSHAFKKNIHHTQAFLLCVQLIRKRSNGDTEVYLETVSKDRIQVCTCRNRGKWTELKVGQHHCQVTGCGQGVNKFKHICKKKKMK